MRSRWLNAVRISTAARRSPAISRAADEAVEPGHLDVEDGDVGLVRPDQLDGLVAPAGLADDLVALLLEGLLQVEADDGLVLGDDDAGRHRALPFVVGLGRRRGSVRLGLGHRRPVRRVAGRAAGASYPGQPTASLSRSSRSSCCRSSSLDRRPHVGAVPAHRLGVPGGLAVLPLGERRLRDEGPQAGVVGLVGEVGQLLVG